MKKQDLRLRIFMLLLIAVFAAILVWISRLYNVEHDREIASKHWDVTIGSAEYHDVALSELVFPNVKIGDEVVMTTVFDTGRVVPNPQLFLFTDHAAVEVYVDGKKIYAEGVTDYRLGNIVPCGNQWIDLPADYMGKTLAIHLYVSEHDAFSNLQEVYVENNSSSTRSFLYDYMFSFVINSFLLVLGFVIAVATTLIMDLKEEWFALLCLAGFAICVALWSFSNTNLLRFFINDLGLRVRIEYTTLYLEPLLFLMYFRRECMRCSSKFYRVGFHCMVGAQGTFVVFAIFCQFFRIIRFPTLLPVQHVLLLAMFFYLVAFLTHCLLKHEKISKMLIIGMACITASGAFDLVMYNLKKFFSVVSPARFRGFFSLGTLIFVVCLVLDLIFQTMQGVRSKSQAELYEQMAYTDSLTGLSNRRRMEEVFDEVDRMGESYCVVSFDLNWLKRVNDTMGHDVGDAYLQSFADALRETFRGVGLVFRLGGDEFVAVIRGKITAEQQVTMLNARICKINAENPSWNMSVAAGAASSEARPGISIRGAYRLADERMYANKKEMKAEH